MEGNKLQQIFFQQIKQTLPPQLSLVNEIAEILNISIDSAYRRIRGEKQVSFEEIQLLATHFKISVDHILHLQSDAFIFHGRITNNADYRFEVWQESVLQHLQMIAQIKPNHYYYLAKEIPFLYYYLLPEIAAFKSYFFLKSILYDDNWKNVKFSLQNSFEQYYKLWRDISNTYSSIPSTEIWGVENISTTIHQIQFYRITGSMSNEDALLLLEKMDELLSHIQLQAEHGVKIAYQQKPSSHLPEYKMFTNDLIMGDNMQMMQIGDTKLTYINHSVINFIMTRDPAFNDYMRKTFSIISQKSNQISGINEKDRLVFFNKLKIKIEIARKEILK